MCRELAGSPVAADEWRARMAHRRDQLSEQLEYWRGLVAEGAAAGEAITAEWGRANIRPGDLVRFGALARGRAREPGQRHGAKQPGTME